MKTMTKKLLSVFLAALIVLPCVIPAFSATKDNVRQYGKEGGYLAIGDSISRGCGSDGFYLDQDKAEGGQYDLYYMRNVKGAIPTQIAEAVGCKMPDDMADQDATFWPCCYPGMTVAMMLDLLGVDDGFKDEKLNYAYYCDMLQYFGYEGSFDGVRPGHVYKEGECGQCGNIIELIKKADLITVQLGMCDIFYRTYRIVSNGGMLKDGMKFDLSSTDAIKNLLQTAITEMAFGYKYWEEHYTMLLEKIMELNPDATIVMVGSFNVVNQLTITDDMIFPLGNLFSAITDGMNRHYRQWEKKYGVIYCDIANTETLAAENDWSLLGDFKDNTFTGTHPSQKGYDYIVRQILSVLPEENTSKNLRIDLGRFTKVDEVYING
ncbi:MAG: SGNH/GDSL hydrolase family protein, partial [Clostridiales bacterium]|nr:SGNH/GDSL hydrolase family protein [Clostridiales bacterium]